MIHIVFCVRVAWVQWAFYLFHDHNKSHICLKTGWAGLAWPGLALLEPAIPGRPQGSSGDLPRIRGSP